MHIYVGWDANEAIAYEVFKFSIMRRAEFPVQVHPLRHRQLRHDGDFFREWRMDGAGQWYDVVDGNPFSTEFSYTRFLVPHLHKKNGLKGPALFYDCDMLALDDLNKILTEFDPTKAVMVVQHEHKPNYGLKMDGVIQTTYPRKNWSSCMLFNTDHPDCEVLTPQYVSTQPGRSLHRFEWTENVGELDPKWNYLAGEDTHEDKFRRLVPPAVVHFTSKNPWLGQDVPYAEEWHREHRLYQNWK